ncbi:hypothetical protein FVR03_14325 [Pontibacter qinzhouensis]|uniref:STAS/SEC14 domain-containing protein n=1 Tax=Pontibacter qinzhouensis TaxID=2603253 RepID=A0A5C8JMA6_9BACT|nr:hypothetical protein [Pontibacter qinzhouensis]TXK38156.1 hypothetical protein FVR03_14325 [Pontibacter qinzhouensis]
MRREQLNQFGKIYYVVEYQQSRDIINTVWHGYASKNDIRTACSVGLELLRETGCRYKLNDNTNLRGPWSEMVEWLEQAWLPGALHAGLRYLAHVAAPGTFGEEAGKVMQVGQIGQQLTYGMFDNRMEALIWLSACQEKEKQHV